MKLRGKVLAGAVGLLAACSLSPIGSAIAEESGDSVSLSIRQDTFFGFYTVVAGQHKISDNFGLSYGGWWYQDVRGNLGVHSNPWTEIDVGVYFTAFDKKLSVMPMIGTVHGSLLSTGNVEKGAPAQAFEGIVPSVTANWSDGFFEAEAYWSFYKSIRNVSAEQRGAFVGACSTDCTGTWDFMHYWVNAGIQVHPVLSVGVHWEHLQTTRDSRPGWSGQNFYRWIGPYVEFKGPSNTAFRFTAGHNIDGEVFGAGPLSDPGFRGAGGNDDFYKMAFTKTF